MYVITIYGQPVCTAPTLPLAMRHGQRLTSDFDHWNQDADYHWTLFEDPLLSHNRVELHHVVHHLESP